MCVDCQPNNPILTFPLPPASPCTNCDNSDCPNGVINSTCVYYGGVNLPCVGASTNDRLDLILQKIDAKICTTVSDLYSTYNTYCLLPTNTEKAFVEKISQQFCTLKGDFNTFTTTTFPAAITVVNNTINTINHPNLNSCAFVGFNAGTDTIKDALSKLSIAVCNINDVQLNLSTVNWNQCFAGTIPTTIAGGFNTLINQICAIQSGGGSGTLPVFDNTGTCLSSPTATDSLQATVIKIRSRLCQTPTYNSANITAGCTGIVGSDTLEQALNKTIAKLGTVSGSAVTAVNTSQFTLAPVDPLNPCLGQKISLNSALTDRFVAANASDASPGTLIQKLAPLGGITIDDTTTPGKVTIGFSGTTDTYKVKVNNADPTPDFLGNKISGKVNTFITTTAVTNGITNKVDVGATLDLSALVTAILDMIEDTPELKTRFCSLVASCPSPCQPPSNPQAVIVP